MNRGAKIALALGGGAVALGALLVLGTKKASAATPDVKPPLPMPDENAPVPEQKGDGVVVVPDNDQEQPAQPPAVVPLPEAGFTRDGPFSVPGIQDAAETARLLLRWWAAEGESLAFADLDMAGLKAAGFPRDFGSVAGDVGDTWGERQKWMGAAFRVLSGMDDAPVTLLKGELTNELVLALRRWAASQVLEPMKPAPSPSGETQPVIVRAPVPQDAVMVPEQSAPAPSSPPFVPPMPQQAPAAPLPPAIEKLPEVQPAPPVPVSAPPAEQSSLVPEDTARLVAALLADEASSGWKKISPAVTAWQKSRGLKQDGQFGPKSALTVAAEIGTVPIVRYWPKGSFPEGRWLSDYQAALQALATSAPEPRSTQLRISAQREAGQGFGSKQSALPLSQQIQLAKVA